MTNHPKNIAANGTRVADWNDWVPTNEFEVNAIRDFQLSIRKAIQQEVVEPGIADKPSVMYTTNGKTILQFKSFGFASNNKILLSGIQRKRDMEVYTGFTAMLGLAYLSYLTNCLLRGQEPTDDYKQLALEVIDRSGTVALMMEVVNIGQKLGAFGESEGVTRYQSRNLVGALLGPSYGKTTDIGDSLYTIFSTLYGNHDFTTQDVKKLSRLFPMQNIAYVAGLNDMFITGIGEAFNLPETRKGK